MLIREEFKVAKTQETQMLEKSIWEVTQRTGTFGCFEVTIGYGGKERVDYMTVDTKDVFRCYEIKVSKSDFHSKHKHSFVGHYNYFVLTSELYDQVKEEIPKEIGVYVGSTCVKQAKHQEVSQETCEMLKNSMLRSLYRDSQKLYRSKSSDYVNRTRRQIESLKRELRDLRENYNHFYENVRVIYGGNLTRLLSGGKVTFSILTGGLINKEEAEKELTVHQKILLLDRRNLAKLLCNMQGKSYSYGKL